MHNCQPLSTILWHRIACFVGHSLFLQDTCRSVCKSKYIVYLTLIECFVDDWKNCKYFNWINTNILRKVNFDSLQDDFTKNIPLLCWYDVKTKEVFIHLYSCQLSIILQESPWKCLCVLCCLWKYNYCPEKSLVKLRHMEYTVQLCSCSCRRILYIFENIQHYNITIPLLIVTGTNCKQEGKTVKKKE
jgi:hypothetical protein